MTITARGGDDEKRVWRGGKLSVFEDWTDVTATGK